MSKHPGHGPSAILPVPGGDSTLGLSTPDQARPLLEECRVDTINPQISVLDEFKLRDELKAMRAHIAAWA